MLEFVKANTVLYAKEHVHYIDKVKKDRLWEEIGRRVGMTGQYVKRWFQSQHTRYSKVNGEQRQWPESATQFFLSDCLYTNTVCTVSRPRHGRHVPPDSGHAV